MLPFVLVLLGKKKAKEKVKYFINVNPTEASESDILFNHNSTVRAVSATPTRLAVL